MMIAFNAQVGTINLFVDTRIRRYVVIYYRKYCAFKQVASPELISTFLNLPAEKALVLASAFHNLAETLANELE